MANLTPRQMADALRKCGGTIVCDGCPYVQLGTAKCIQTMQRDAADMIEKLDADSRKLSVTIEKLQPITCGN